MSDNMNNAVETIVEMYLRDEMKNFMCLVGIDDITFEDFEDMLVDHVFYSLIILNYKGDEDDIKKWKIEFYEEHIKQEEEEVICCGRKGETCDNKATCMDMCRDCMEDELGMN
jgi:hypothetical protein